MERYVRWSAMLDGARCSAMLDGAKGTLTHVCTRPCLGMIYVQSTSIYIGMYLLNRISAQLSLSYSLSILEHDFRGVVRSRVATLPYTA